MLVGIVAEAGVEADIEDGDSAEEDEDGDWGTFPVDDWVHGSI